MGSKETLVQNPVISPIRILYFLNKKFSISKKKSIRLVKKFDHLEIMTVNNGEELLIVSTKEIVACLRAIKPRTIEKSLFRKHLNCFLFN